MPKTAPKYEHRQYYSEIYNTHAEVREFRNAQIQTHNQPLPVTKKIKKRQNHLQTLFLLTFIVLLSMFVLPFGFNRVTKSLVHGSRYPQIKTDYHKLRFPTTAYLANDLISNQRYFTKTQTNKPQMLKITETYRLGDLENDLKYLMAQYKTIKPAIYVWQYGTEKFADINAEQSYSAASIIKIPVLIELFRSIEKGQLKLDDTMVLTDYYKAEGSGSLQFKADNSLWTIDSLARVMITESDNSATNMLMAKLGSMTDINSAIRQWGLSKTYVRTWLPDLTGTNRTTAKDMATMLYNIDTNQDFLDLSSKEKIFDYMGHVHNNRLIQAGLGQGALFMHKTGDIGTMLGDAGIVFAPNGNKYIVVILANRPKNSVDGKDFIVKASEIIYNSMVK